LSSACDSIFRHGKIDDQERYKTGDSLGRSGVM
jgi:hypothetical protein